jgi:Asp-tRNA(Asn)/Glu-tRNA(Gln) amidotransferase A subunit family amidase
MKVSHKAHQGTKNSQSKGSEMDEERAQIQDEEDNQSITRRTMMKQSAAATLGAVAMPPHNLLATPEPPNFSGLAAEYDKYDALGLAELIAKKQITPVDLLNAVRQRVEKINPKINAICHQFFDKAEAQIKAGLPKGPFYGVPFLLKDLRADLEGTPMSSGSRLFKDNVSTQDATITARYKQAGLVIFGKSATPEFGLTTTTESVLTGKTRNPYNLERIAGGSSGGSAAAVAARILPLAHASDGGGSIRIPASCCGLFGLKTTRGRVPLGPDALEGWGGMSVQHAVSISVRDSAAHLDATAGTEPGSPYDAPKPARPFLQEVGVSPGKLRIALMLEPPAKSPVHDECKKAARDAAKLCESLGHIVEEAAPVVDAAAMRDAQVNVIAVSIAKLLEDAAKTSGRAVTDKDVETVTWAYYQSGLRQTAVTYARAITTFQQLGLTLAKFHEKYDVILSPTLAKPPIELDILSLSPKDIQAYSRAIGEFSPFTALFNMTGQPSMSVPLHWTPDGLPVGVMFTTRFGDEATLIRLAAQLEKAKPWANHRPQI